MRTLSHMPEDRRQRTAQETLDIYAPIANRLGMSKIKNELEELSFKYLDPAGYQALTAKVENKRKAADVEIDYLRKTVIAKLSEAQVPVKQVDGRLKRLYSINQKLKRQRIELDQSTTSWRCGSSRTASRIATRRWASSTRPGRRCRGVSRISSRCRGRTATSRCTRR
jgi:hypothetical protein